MGPGTVPTVKCETCGEVQEMNLLGDPDPPCENCGNRALMQVDN